MTPHIGTRKVLIHYIFFMTLKKARYFIGHLTIEIYQTRFMITRKISSYKIASLFNIASLTAGLCRPKKKLYYQHILSSI
jgi:hypothetical protein